MEKKFKSLKKVDIEVNSTDSKDIILKKFDSIVKKIDIPDDIKNMAKKDTKSLLNEPHTKETMANKIDSIISNFDLNSDEYSKSKKYYSTIDSSYMIYDSMVKAGYSKNFAWCVATCQLYRYWLSTIKGSRLSESGVKNDVEKSLKQPFFHMIKNILIGSINYIIFSGAFFLGTFGLGAPIIILYTIAVIINIIRLSISIGSHEKVKLKSSDED